MTNWKTAVLKRKIRASLKTIGVVKEEDVNRVITESLGGGGGQPLLTSIPRVAIKKVVEAFNKHGKRSSVTITWGKSGKFRVYTADGHRKLVASGQRTGGKNRKAPAHPAAA